MFDFLNQSWFGSLVGLLGFILGIVGILLWRNSKIGARPKCQMKSFKLIGKKSQELPSEVDILFKGNSVGRLTLTKIYIWNAGKLTLNGSQIVEADPLRCEVEETESILKADVAAITRKVNNVTVAKHENKQNVAFFNFDYLDPGDGARIDLLHTSEKQYLHLKGCIRGIPGGIKDHKLTLPAYLEKCFKMIYQNISLLYIIALIMGVAVFMIGLFPDEVLSALSSSKERAGTDGFMRFRITMFVLAALYIILPVSLLLSRRKMYPGSLDYDLGEKELEEDTAALL